jgi:HK97 family phage prohead protease
VSVQSEDRITTLRAQLARLDAAQLVAPGRIIHRSAGELEPVGDGWTLEGLAVPYGVETRVTDNAGRSFYFEEFGPGCFHRDVVKGGRWINLFVGHLGDFGDRFLGRCIGLDETGDGLFAAFRVNRSHPQAEAARSGELTAWSVSARATRSRTVPRAGRQVVVREQAALDHVAATASPQYAGAGVLVARHHRRTPKLDGWRRKYART